MLFYLHLWVGLLLAAWVVLIGLSGSVLVFEEDLTRAMLPGAALPLAAEQASVPGALAAAQRALPAATPFYITMPDNSLPFFQVWMHRLTPGGDRVLTLDARTGRLVRECHPRLARSLASVHDFHVYLLLGQRGLQINALLSAALLLLACTGILLWWPGVRFWYRGLRVSLQHHWRRVNFDLHHAVGFWTLLWSLCWAISSIYFGFPAASQRVLGFFSPVQAMRPPTPAIDAGTGDPPSLATVISLAQRQSPLAFLSGVALPSAGSPTYTITLDTAEPGDFSHREILTISARTGRLLSIWHYGANRTASDTLLWALYALHFGTLWGTAWKVLWAFIGLSLPVLAISGSLMYWNRYLARKLRSLAAHPSLKQTVVMPVRPSGGRE